MGEWMFFLGWYPCGPCAICFSAACFLGWSALRHDGSITVPVLFTIAGLAMLPHGVRIACKIPGSVQGLEEAAKKIDGTIADLLQAGTIRLLSCEWLVRYCHQALPLRRHQDLPDEAFLTPDDAARAHRQGKVFVLSYGWLTPEHPDPHALVLDRVRRFLESSWARPYSPLTFGLFWDFTSLPQWERTPEEDAVFQSGLKCMGNLYGSLWHTVVLQLLQLPEAPPGCGVDYNTRPYSSRGWCNFEAGAARIAAHNRAGGMGDVLPKLIDISGETPEPYDVHSNPKPTVEEIDHNIERSHFTGRGDKEVVKEMLKDFNGALAVGSHMSELRIRASLQRASLPVSQPRPGGTELVGLASSTV